MTEPKETAARVADLKKRELELADGRNALKAQIVGLIDGHVAELREIGFEYTITENGAASKARVCSLCNEEGHSKATCPRKEAK